MAHPGRTYPYIPLVGAACRHACAPLLLLIMLAVMRTQRRRRFALLRLPQAQRGSLGPARPARTITLIPHPRSLNMASGADPLCMFIFTPRGHAVKGKPPPFTDSGKTRRDDDRRTFCSGFCSGRQHLFEGI